MAFGNGPKLIDVESLDSDHARAAGTPALVQAYADARVRGMTSFGGTAENHRKLGVIVLELRRRDILD